MPERPETIWSRITMPNGNPVIYTTPSPQPFVRMRRSSPQPATPQPATPRPPRELDIWNGQIFIDGMWVPLESALPDSSQADILEPPRRPPAGGANRFGTTSTSHVHEGDETTMPTINNITSDFARSAALCLETCGSVIAVERSGNEYILRFEDQCTRNIPVADIPRIPADYFPRLFPSSLIMNMNIVTGAATAVPAVVPTIMTVESWPVPTRDVSRVHRAVTQPRTVSFPGSSTIGVGDLLDENISEAQHNLMVGRRVARALATVGITIPSEYNQILGQAVDHSLADTVTYARDVARRIRVAERTQSELRTQARVAEEARVQATEDLTRMNALRDAVLAWKTTPNNQRTAKLEKFNLMLAAIQASQAVPAQPEPAPVTADIEI